MDEVTGIKRDTDREKKVENSQLEGGKIEGKEGGGCGMQLDGRMWKRGKVGGFGMREREKDLEEQEKSRKWR